MAKALWKESPMRMSPKYCLALLTSLTLGATLMIGCAASESGTTGTGGTIGSGGSTGSGGSGSGGSGSGGTGSGGTSGSGGMIADVAPPADVKPETAADVQAETATDGAGGGVTFTALYMELFGPTAPAASSCMGSDCHNPGVKDNVNLMTKMQAYTTLKAKVTPTNVGNSALIRRLESTTVSMRMPLNKPALTAVQIARVRAWIMAGALNN
jgi:hypothetical protein